MAVVTSLVGLKQQTFRIHPTRVKGHFAVFESGGSRFVQLNTYGSENRQDKDTVSQTMQFDENSARELRRLLAEAFPD
jgi:hypothetical protein